MEYFDHKLTKNAKNIAIFILSILFTALFVSGCGKSNENHEKNADFIYYPSRAISANMDLKYVAIVGKEEAYIKIGEDEKPKKISDVNIESTTIMFKFKDNTGIVIDLATKLMMYFPRIPCSNLSDAEVYSLDIYRSKI